MVEITGPDDLLDVLRARLPDEDSGAFSEQRTGEIRVETDQTVLETRLGAWTASHRGGVR